MRGLSRETLKRWKTKPKIQNSKLIDLHRLSYSVVNLRISGVTMENQL
jgi:hypothetical protein